MGKNAEDQKPSEEFDYSSLYKPNSEIYVIKKDGSKELFNASIALRFFSGCLVCLSCSE